jgi:hypothetical protein
VDCNFCGVHPCDIRGERNPFAATIIMELGRIELAFVKQGRCIRAGLIDAVRDVFIQEFTAFIIAEIDNHTTIRGNDAGGIFMFEPTQCGAFDRC